MKNGIVLVTAMVLFSAGFAYAGEVTTTIDASWTSKYIWRGFDKYNDRAAFQPSANFDFNNGWSFNVWASYAGASGSTHVDDAGEPIGDDVSTVNGTEWDYTITYANSWWDGESYATNYAASWVFYDYPDMASNDADFQEFNFAFAWPDLCPYGVVPSYIYAHMWPSEGGGAVRGAGGPIHIFSLNYGLETASLPNPVDLGWQLVYNDGAYGASVNHDWSHMVWSATTTFDCEVGTFTPGIFYQTSMNDSVNKNDEFWCGFSYSVNIP